MKPVSTHGAELALVLTTCSVVVCVCVVNLMIVYESQSTLLCGTSPPREATIKSMTLWAGLGSHTMLVNEKKTKNTASCSLYVAKPQRQQTGRSAENLCRNWVNSTLRSRRSRLSSCVVLEGGAQLYQNRVCLPETFWRSNSLCLLLSSSRLVLVLRALLLSLPNGLTSPEPFHWYF